MATKEEYDAAIARVKNSPQTAKPQDWELVNKAAKQQGSQGNDAKDAKGEKRTSILG